MYSVRKGNLFQMFTLVYFIMGNLFLGLLVQQLDVELNIITNLLISQYLFVGLAVLLYSLYNRSSLSKDLYIKPIHWIDVLLCIGIAWTLMPILSFINVLSQFFVKNQIQDALRELTDLPFFLTLLLTAVTPAILEELLSRSIIIRNFQKKSVMVTCLVSGLFFGFTHLNINQFLYAFVMGVVMCYIVMITGSTISSMIIHFTINASGTILLYLISRLLTIFEASGATKADIMAGLNPTSQELLISLLMMFIFALFATPLAVILINLLLKRHNKPFKGSFKVLTKDFMLTQSTGAANNSVEVINQEKVVTWPLIVSALLFFIFSILIELSATIAG